MLEQIQLELFTCKITEIMNKNLIQQNKYGKDLKTYESRFPSSSNFDKVPVSFDKLNNNDLFILQIHANPSIF